MKTRVASAEDMLPGTVVRLATTEISPVPFADCVVLGPSIINEGGWTITRPYYCWNLRDDNDLRVRRHELEHETFEIGAAHAYLVYINSDGSVLRLNVDKNIKWHQ